ncbi:unnamed protein product [Pedinophyceae sp. YPF-701]|nr:unnamed protein product [Pedinophyceae sp. YPF-701]
MRRRLWHSWAVALRNATRGATEAGCGRKCFRGEAAPCGEGRGVAAGANHAQWQRTFASQPAVDQERPDAPKSPASSCLVRLARRPEATLPEALRVCTPEQLLWEDFARLLDDMGCLPGTTTNDLTISLSNAAVVTGEGWRAAQEELQRDAQRPAGQRRYPRLHAPGVQERMYYSIRREWDSLDQALLIMREKLQKLEVRGVLGTTAIGRTLLDGLCRQLEAGIVEKQRQVAVHPHAAKGSASREASVTAAELAFLQLEPGATAKVTVVNIMRSLYCDGTIDALFNEDRGTGLGAMWSLKGASVARKVAREIGDAVQAQVLYDNVKLRGKATETTLARSRELAEDLMARLKNLDTAMVEHARARNKPRKKFERSARGWIESVATALSSPNVKLAQHDLKAVGTIVEAFGGREPGQRALSWRMQALMRNLQDVQPWSETTRLLVGLTLLELALMSLWLKDEEKPGSNKPGRHLRAPLAPVEQALAMHDLTPSKFFAPGGGAEDLRAAGLFPAIEYGKLPTFNAHLSRRLYGGNPCIWPTQALLDRLHDYFESAASNQVVRPHMVLPPVPWTRSSGGGTLQLQTGFMLSRRGPQQDRMRDADVQMQRLETDSGHLTEVAPGELADRAAALPYQAYRAVNVLSCTKWRINRLVLDVAEALWNAGGGVAKLPRRSDRYPDLNVPAPARDRFCMFRSGQQLVATRGRCHEELVAFEARSHDAKQQAGDFSESCQMREMLRYANEVRDLEYFYQPHFVDFRGRVYPMHPHLSHVGRDISRGLLRFATARPLGRQGLDWLLIHAANTFGQDKLPLAGRLQWSQDRLDDMVQAAKDPLAAPRWWTQAENPFQFLATCDEIRAAFASGDPTAFESSLPVHQDGSCNGLQHFAALGRDLPGGAAVNLVPGDRPSDVYSEVAVLTRAQVERDTQRSHRDKPLAEAVLPEVDRKFVKQTVMTTVYGVTFIGAKQQINARLRERGWKDDHFTTACSVYAARVTLQAVGQKFSQAKSLMRWMASCAGIVAKNGAFVAWTTPLGLTVQQHYGRPSGKVNIHGGFASAPAEVHKGWSKHTFWNESDAKDMQVDTSKQKTAFPPNYVHSLDSSHMMRTAVECNRLGIEFAAVHDSFWTHAADVDSMSRVLRDEFVALHSEPLLEQLVEQLAKQVPAGADALPPIPPRGELDLDSVRGSTYFFC